MSVEVKQEALGPHNSTEKQFQTVHKLEQSYDYISTWDNRIKTNRIIISNWKKEWSLVCEKT